MIAEYTIRLTPDSKDGSISLMPGSKGKLISSIVLNDDYTLTITYTDGSSTTTGSIRGAQGTGVSGIEKISSVGLVDTYQMTFSDGSTFNFDVNNGEQGEQGEQGIQGEQGEQGISPTVTVQEIDNGHQVTITDVNGDHVFVLHNGEQGEQGIQGETGTGIGIDSITYIGTAGLVDTYRITLTDSTYYDFNVTNGKDGAKGTKGDTGEKGDQGIQGVGISNVEKILTIDNVDTYRITLTDGTSYTFNVTNGVSPIVQTQAIPNGHQITIIDASGTQHTFDVMDGTTPTVEVGGRNLLLDSEAERTSPASASASAYVSIYYASEYGSQYFTEDSLLTVSAQYEVTGNEEENATIYAQCENTTINNIQNYGTSSSIYIINASTGIYKRSFLVTADQAEYALTHAKYIRFRLKNATDGATLTVKNVKLEIGNRATDYTPAPEDSEVQPITQAEIDAIAI